MAAEGDQMKTTPPSWADALLRMFLKPADFDSVPRDLLEAYRDSIRPARGQTGADIWYVTQVLGFLWRSSRTWAVVLAAAFVIRTALDWRAPPSDFHARSIVSTLLAVGLLLAVGVRASWRSASFAAGIVAGVATAAISAGISVVSAAGLFALWHDADTIAAIRGSGGLGEVFVLPVMLNIPGAVLGAVGGIVGWQSRGSVPVLERVLSRSRAPRSPRRCCATSASALPEPTSHRPDSAARRRQ
jgi:hypothetical protein